MKDLSEPLKELGSCLFSLDWKAAKFDGGGVIKEEFAKYQKIHTVTEEMTRMHCENM